MTLLLRQAQPVGAGTVLVVEGGAGQGRSAVATVRALRRGGYAPLVATCGERGPASVSRHAAGTLDLPPSSSPDFAAAVLRALEDTAAFAAMPVSDAAVVALDLDPAGLLDKAHLALLAAEAGIDAVSGRAFGSREELLAEATALDYPVVVKGVATTPADRAMPAQLIGSPTALASIPAAAGRLLVQPHIAEPMTAVAGVTWHGQLIATVHQRYLRTWPIDCGTACAAISTTPDLDLESRLRRLLAGHSGVFQAQFIGGRLIDLNPRPYGSLPLAVAAGVNLPAIACDLARGRRVEVTKARPGVRYRWVEGDLRHVFAAVRTRQMGASQAGSALRPHLGTAHSTGSAADPGPLLLNMSRSIRARRL